MERRSIYLATGFANGVGPEGESSLPYQRVYQAVQKLGWRVTFNWTKVPEVSNNKKTVAVYEMSGVVDADFVGLILPGGRGAHWECGAAAVTETPVVILAEHDDDLYREDGEYQCVFYNLPHVYVTRTCDEFLSVLTHLQRVYYDVDEDEDM